MKRLYSIFLACLAFISISYSQTTRYVTTNSTSSSGGLGYEISQATSGDIIEIQNDIIVSSQISFSKDLTINGNGYTISVQNPGVTEDGVNSSNPSTHLIFNISGTSKTIVISNLKLVGGNTSSGGCISNSAENLTLNFVTLTGGRNSSTGGGGLYNSGIIYMNDCILHRNSARYGGGFLNDAGVMIVEGTTFSENRAEVTGGGGCENKNGGEIYMNNCTFSNNKSLEIGGGINNYQGSLYVLNSTFSGNVVYGGNEGAAIGNRSTCTVINSIFAYNYQETSGSSSSPASYILDDFNYITMGSSGKDIDCYYSIFHSTTNDISTSSTGNIQYTGDEDGSDNDIFAGGTYTYLTDGYGNEIGTAKIFQPYLVNNTTKTATLQIGSFPNKSANKGVITGFTYGNGTPSIGYKDPSSGSWVNILGTSASSNQVTDDQLDSTRANPPTRGAVESEINTVYMLKVVKPTNGSTTGGSLYGDIYEDGDKVTLTASPSTGYAFDYWKSSNTGSSVSTDNPWTLTINSDSSVEAVFKISSSYTVTYNSNNATAGAAPSVQTFTSGNSVTISNQNTLYRDEYYFAGWNTNSTGTATDYSPSTTYNTQANLTLYAKWIPYIKYYVKSGSTGSLNNTNSWSGTKDGSGGSPSNFNNDKIFILSNSSGSTSFTTGGNWSVDGAIQIPSGATLNITSSSTTTLSNDISNDGKIIGASGSVLELDGSSRQYLGGVNSLYDFNSNNSDGINILDSTVIINSLSLSDGTLYTDGKLTLRSTAGNTAIVNEIASGAAINGNVRVEQYIPAKRAFRFISPTVTTTTSIYENWQENGRNEAGLGTHITGSKDGSNGFDATLTGNASLFTFNNGTGKWGSVNNTNNTTLTAGTPYRLMIRGDRRTNLNSNTITGSNTTIRAIGTLTTGDKAINFGNSGSGNDLFLGNPYQAPVSMASLINTNGSGVDDDYYIWDPNLSTRGAYVSINATTGAKTNSSSDIDNYLQPGQACFLISTGSNASVTFKESSKGTSITDAWRTTTPDASLNVQLFQSDSFNTGGKSCDGISLYFSDEYSSDIDFGDVIKYGNLDETISWNINGSTFVKLENKTPATNEVFLIKATNYRDSKYTFKINFDGDINADVMLYDKYLNSYHTIETGITLVEFVTNGTNMDKSDRFEIMFNPKTTSTYSTRRNKISIYPNPVKNNWIQLNGVGQNQFVNVIITDLLGRKVWEFHGLLVENSIEIPSYLKNIQVGFINLTTVNDSHTERIVFD